MDGDAELGLTPDPTQSRNLAGQYPDKLELMKNIWFFQAGLYNGLPLDDRSTSEVLGGERPQLRPPAFSESDPQDKTFPYTYYPGGSEIPEAVAPNIRTRSYAIEATISNAEADMKGVLMAHGGRFGGHSFYIHKDDEGQKTLCYVYNWLGQQQQKITCPLPSLEGEMTFKVAFTKEKTLQSDANFGSSTIGTVKLYINDIEKATTLEGTFTGYSGKFLTQPGKFSLCGEGFNIGRDPGQPVSSDYEHEIPYEFEGATLKTVIVTIQNDAGAIDYEKELRAMLMRD
jgi:arylsulfatase